MKTLNNLVKFSVLIIIMCCTTNCQHDEVINIEDETTILKEKSPFVSYFVTESDIEANEKLNISFRKLATVQANSFTEDYYSSQYNFTVNTETIKYIEDTTTNSHSYTFSIDRNNVITNNLENLVFSYNQENDLYEASIVTYYLTPQQKIELLTTQHISTVYDVSFNSLNIDISNVLAETIFPVPCTFSTTTYHVTPEDGTFLYNDGSTCQHVNEEGEIACEAYTTLEINCPDGGNDGSATDGVSNPYSNANNTASGGNSSTGNSSGITINNDRVVTTPTQKVDYVELTNDLNSLFNGNDSWELDDTINSNEALYINNVQDFEALLNDSSFEPLNEENFEDQDGLNHTIFKVKINLLSTLRIDISQKLEDAALLQEYEVSDIETNHSGFTLGSEWVQNDFIPGDFSINGNLATIDIKGELIFTIFFKGIGTVGIDFKHYRVVINIETGEAVSITVLD